MNAKLSCSFLLPFVFTSMAERAALFFFSRSELLSTSYCIRPGTDCFPLVFLVSEGRARLINTTMPCEGARRSGRTIRAVVAVRPTRNNHGRSGPLPTSRASRTTTTVGKEVTPPIPDTNRVRNNRNDRPPPRVSGSLLCTPPLIVSAWKARPVSWDGAGGGGERKQHQHRCPPAGFVVFPLPPPDVQPQRRVFTNDREIKTRNESVRTHLPRTKNRIEYKREKMGEQQNDA